MLEAEPRPRTGTSSRSSGARPAVRAPPTAWRRTANHGQGSIPGPRAPPDGADVRAGVPAAVPDRRGHAAGAATARPVRPLRVEEPAPRSRPARARPREPPPGHRAVRRPRRVLDDQRAARPRRGDPHAQRLRRGDERADRPERRLDQAVRRRIERLAALRAAATRPGCFAITIGIHTGEVIVDRGTHAVKGRLAEVAVHEVTRAAAACHTSAP